MLVVEADYCFEQGDYVTAAQIYAQSPRSFEEVKRTIRPGAASLSLVAGCTQVCASRPY